VGTELTAGSIAASGPLTPLMHNRLANGEGALIGVGVVLLVGL
jgi:hypothetical protein